MRAAGASPARAGAGAAVPRHVAFLRAINVGGHTVKMARLRALFEALGLADVETYIASGNVIFRSAEAAGALEARIAGHLAGALGYDVATFIRSPAELAAILERPAPEPSPAGAQQPATRVNSPVTRPPTLYIGFVAAEPDAEARHRLHALRSPTDELEVRGRELYWRCHTRMSESAISGALLEKTLGVAATLRNANTVGKLVAKYPPDA